MEVFKKYKPFISEKNDALIADRIKDIYLEVIDDMSITKQQHFLSRLSKAYGYKWKTKIRELGKQLSVDMLDIFEKRRNGNYKGAIENFIALRNDSNANMKSKAEGNQWVLDNKETVGKILGYLEVLENFNIICRLRCEDYLKEDIEDIRNWLIGNWEDQIDRIIEDPKIFSMIPVQAITVFYYMSSLKIIDPNVLADKEKIFLDSFRKEYEGKLDDEIVFNNYLYALTHIIIGESWFYEFKLPTYKQKYGWLIKFIKENRERILECIPDIVIEVGVVLLLCNEMTEVNKYKKYTRNQIGSGGYILPIDPTKGIIEAEHTNILAILILKGIR